MPPVVCPPVVVAPVVPPVVVVLLTPPVVVVLVAPPLVAPLVAALVPPVVLSEGLPIPETFFWKHRVRVVA